jgi:hypothetical protein
VLKSSAAIGQPIFLAPNRAIVENNGYWWRGKLRNKGLDF